MLILHQYSGYLSLISLDARGQVDRVSDLKSKVIYIIGFEPGACEVWKCWPIFTSHSAKGCQIIVGTWVHCIDVRVE